MKRAVFFFCVFVCVMTCWGGSPTDFDPGRAGFAIKFKEELSSYRVMSVFVLPGQKMTLEAVAQEPGKTFRLVYSQGWLTSQKPDRWEWVAPELPGLYVLRIAEEESTETISLNIFVMVPFSQLKEGYLEGCRIGTYPVIPLKMLPRYKVPQGFVRVTKENEETPLSPHFKLKQFLCKQPGSYPKFVVLRERLLLKLELILEKVNEAGYKARTFNILSGYRTPYYNHAIGNVKFSRHIFGGAADIFIDEDPADGMMDDLNADGRIDYKDAVVLYELIDKMYAKPWYSRFIGGLGHYKRTSMHGPFVHVDTRGFRARWYD
jgi:hypothetical protein